MRASHIVENNYNLDEGSEMTLHRLYSANSVQSTSHHVRGLVIRFKYVRCALDFDVGVKRQLFDSHAGPALRLLSSAEISFSP